MVETLADKLRSLGASYLTPAQKLRVLETNVRPALTYHMSITPCAPQFLEKLDGMVGRFVKKTLGLVRCVPTAMLREEHAKFGLGCPSLTAEYAAACAKGLVDALQDQALRGAASRALLLSSLSRQATCLAGLDPHFCGNELNYCLRARQLAVLHKSNMTLWLGETEQFPRIVSELWAKTGDLEARLRAIPALHRLLRLPGVTDLRQLLNARGTHVLSAKELAQLAGKTNSLPRGARVALLQFTRALCCEDAAKAPRHTHLVDLPAASRTVLPQWRVEVRCPAYPSGPQAGARQRMIEECFAILTAMGQEPRDGPAPSPLAVPGATSEQQPEQPQGGGPPSGRMETEDAPGRPPPAQHKRQRGDRHKQPCMQRRAREDETRHEISLLALHDPPEEPVTGGELATSLTRATLAKDLETQLVRQLGKKDRTSTPHLQKVAGQVSCALYDNNLRVAAVHASRLVKPPPRRRGDTTTRPSQMQMLVEWRPTLIDAWARPLVERAGYKIQSEAQVSRAELHADPSHPLRHQVQCELCCGRHGGTHDLAWCDACHRCYHMACLGQPQEPPAQGWECHACAAQLQQGGNQGLIMVKWGREWHPQGRDMQHPAACFDSPEGRAALADWAAARDAPAAVPAEAADARLPNLVRQQPEDRPGTWKTTRGSAIRNKVKLQVAPINPQADIAPPGAHAIVIRDTDTWQGEGEPHGLHTLACVHGPDGRLVGTLGVDALASLKQRFDRAKGSGMHDSISPPVGPFEREVAELLCRSKDGQKFKSGAGKTL